MTGLSEQLCWVVHSTDGSLCTAKTEARMNDWWCRWTRFGPRDVIIIQLMIALWGFHLFLLLLLLLVLLLLLMCFCCFFFPIYYLSSSNKLETTLLASSYTSPSTSPLPNLPSTAAAESRKLGFDKNYWDFTEMRKCGVVVGVVLEWFDSIALLGCKKLVVSHLKLI